MGVGALGEQAQGVGWRPCFTRTCSRKVVCIRFQVPSLPGRIPGQSDLFSPARFSSLCTQPLNELSGKILVEQCTEIGSLFRVKLNGHFILFVIPLW